MDISTKTLTELKALVFDELVNIEVAQKNIKLLNTRMEEINTVAPEVAPEVVVDAPVEVVVPEVIPAPEAGIAPETV